MEADVKAGSESADEDVDESELKWSGGIVAVFGIVLVVLVLSLLSCSTNGATQTALTPVSGNALYDTTAFFTDRERDDFADW
jgi:bacteriorhodopsin